MSRRWGKTKLGALLCIATALEGGRAWWVAPSYKMAAVGWNQIKYLGVQIPDALLREGERMLYLPMGGTVQVRSADEPQTLRGEGLDFLVMDECAFIVEAAWTEALRPALSDRKGSAMFISTPKGMNWFWRAWIRGQEGDDPSWRSWRFPTVSNPFIDPVEIEEARRLLPERIHQQEYLAMFLEDSGGVFLRVRDAIDAGRTANEPTQPGHRYMLGVDLARVQDFTVITAMDRHTRRQVYHERFNQISWERQIESIVRTSKAYGNAPIALDSTGVGDMPWETLRKRGVPVLPFHFTNAAKENLIDGLAMDFEAGTIRLMDIPAQTAELLAFQYELTPSRNVRMGAPEGMHDDTVIALALARWACAQPVAGAPAVGGERTLAARYAQEVGRYAGSRRGGA